MAGNQLLVREDYIEGMECIDKRFMSTKYNNREISDVVKDLMSREDRKDTEFRYALLCTEVGDMADELFRTSETGEDYSNETKALSIGQAIVMLLGLAYTRNVDYIAAVNARKKASDELCGNDAKDELLRLNYLVGQIGKYITHDKQLNPGARPHKTRDDEIIDYGKAIARLDSLCGCSGFRMDDAVSSGLKNWVEVDWRKRTSSTNDPYQLFGKVACPGSVEASAYVVSRKNPVGKIYRMAEKEKPILVMEHAQTEELMQTIEYISGIVTDHGGYTCHAATVARQFNIPCIVGTGNATEKIAHGQKVILLPTSHADTGEVCIRPIKRQSAKRQRLTGW